MEKLRVASLFAGIGGVCQGFKNAGFDLAWANEYDKNACITYRQNFKHKLIEDDIHNLTTSTNIQKLEYVDVLTAGFPCQAFSIAGYRKGFDDPRGNLFFETAKIIDQIKPKAFLLENVKNFATHDNGKTIEVVKNTITKDLNYSFIPFILNTREFGNIPQSRERIYMVGFKDEGDIEHFQKKIDIYNINQDEKYRKIIKTHDKNSFTTRFKIPKPIPLTTSIHDFFEDEVGEEFFYDRFEINSKLKSEMTSTETIYQWRRHYVRENKSNSCPTLTANMGTGGHNVPLIRDKDRVRKLTPKECFNFQGFDKIKLPQGMTNSHFYKQAGNSVTVSVIERIANEIKKCLKE